MQIENLTKKITWTELALSRHVVTQRSIYLVLDSNFEYYNIQTMCLEFPLQIFRELEEEDYFGLSIHQKSSLALDHHEFVLEEKKKNMTVKTHLLEQLLESQTINTSHLRRNYLKNQISRAL